MSTMTSYSHHIRWNNLPTSDVVTIVNATAQNAVSPSTHQEGSLIKRALVATKNYFAAVGNAYIEARVRDARYSLSLW